MVTKATRDVITLGSGSGGRPIDDAFDVDGDCGANFTMDGVTIGATVPCDGDFVDLTATNLVVTGTYDATGATAIGTWQATYADIAEYYESDKDYPKGTLVKLGGDKEITATDRSVDDAFGVVSSNPWCVLNSGREGLYLAVALVGRLPVRVIGPVKRNDRLVSSHVGGVARTIKDSEKSCHTPILGRVIADDDRDEERLVEIAFVTLK